MAIAPVAYARRPVSEARASPIAANSTAHSAPMSSPGMSALVWFQTAAPPPALTMVPR